MRFYTLILSALLISNLLMAQEMEMYEGSDSKEANKFYDMAGDYFTDEDYTSAIKYYKLAIKADSNFVEAYDNLGLSYRKRNDLDSAIYYYKASIALYPEGAMAHQNLAVVYGMLEEYDMAITEYELMIANDLENPEGYYGVANTHLLQGTYEDGIPAAIQALKLYKKEGSYYLADGYYLLGLLYYYNEDYDYARHNMKEAEQLGKEIHPIIWQTLASSDSYTLETEADYVRYEDDLVEAVNWLINEPLDYEDDLRVLRSGFVMKWIAGCPYLAVELNEDIVPYTEDCFNCMIVFMGGWAKYAIENKVYDNPLEGNMQGTNAVIQFYNRNKTELGNIKSINKFIELKAKGKLQSYIEKKIK